jgi:diacylglycerol kinase (ATP)
VPPDAGAELIYSSALVKTVFIVNPASANGATGKQWPQVSDRIRERGLEHSSVLTSGPTEATRLAIDALESGADTVVAVGGDGTLSDVANGFFAGGRSFADAALGLLPFGTGGDARRTLGIPVELEAAIDCLKARNVRKIDVGRIEMEALDGGRVVRHFVNIADAGIGGVVVERVNRASKLLGGKATFMFASLATLMTYRPQPVRVQTAERVWEGRAQNVVVANCQYFGGGMHVAPKAEPDDGAFDVVVFGDIARFEAMRSINDIYTAKHMENPKVTSWRANLVEVTSAERVLIDVDGELAGTLPAVFTVLPGALSVVVP